MTEARITRDSFWWLVLSPCEVAIITFRCIDGASSAYARTELQSFDKLLDVGFWQGSHCDITDITDKIVKIVNGVGVTNATY